MERGMDRYVIKQGEKCEPQNLGGGNMSAQCAIL